MVLIAAGPAATQAAQTEVGQPLSAIDWLSNSVSLPPLQPPPAIVAPPAEPVPPVAVTPLGVSVPDDVGLIEANDLSLPINLWGSSSAQELARQLLALPEISTPTLRNFVADLMLAKLAPPIDASVDDIRNFARTQGMTTLREAGLKLIFDGVTTIDEVVRETMTEEA